MLAKSTTLLVLFSLAARLVVATPPACLLAAVNTQPDPSAFKALCSGSNATQVEQYICKNCGSYTQEAQSAFSSVCSGAGVTLSNASSCNNSTSGSASRTSGSLATGSSVVYTTTINGSIATVTSSVQPGATSFTGAGGSGSGTGSGSGASGSGTAGASSTSSSSSGAAARLGMDIVGMAALGVFGAMLAF